MILKGNRLTNDAGMCEENGLTTVILYCGDQDPAGLQVSDCILERLCMRMDGGQKEQ
jgi:hypothetical protein